MTPDMVEQAKMAQRSQIRLHQAFQLFTLKIAYGATPQTAIHDIDEAMDVWGDYQDAHTIEMPAQPDAMGAIFSKFNEMMTEMKKDRARGPDGPAEAFMSPEQIADAEERAWNHYQELAAQLHDRQEIMSPEATADLEQHIEGAREHWRTFGTERLRDSLQQLRAPITYPAGVHIEPPPMCAPGHHRFLLSTERAPRLDECCVLCRRTVGEIVDSLKNTVAGAPQAS
jgi:hypothetical protein